MAQIGSRNIGVGIGEQPDIEALHHADAVEPEGIGAHRLISVLSGVAHHDQYAPRNAEFKEFGAVASRNRVDNHGRIAAAAYPQVHCAAIHLVVAEVEGETGVFLRC